VSDAPARMQLREDEIEFSSIRAQGSGGHNVNKVSSAIHLRFNIFASSLAEKDKQLLARYKDSRITKSGVIVIKAQNYRTKEMNRQDAIERLQTLVASALHSAPVRKPTKATRGSQKRRVDDKIKRGRQKELRRKVFD
jgi:ribosome-associated protein